MKRGENEPLIRPLDFPGNRANGEISMGTLKKEAEGRGLAVWMDRGRERYWGGEEGRRWLLGWIGEGRYWGSEEMSRWKGFLKNKGGSPEARRNEWVDEKQKC